jgi:hypothetical protein
LWFAINVQNRQETARDEQQKQRRSDMTEINTTTPMNGAIKTSKQIGGGRNA